MLRTLFIALSESRSLRAIAERSRLGQRTSARFVAGKEVSDAIRAAAAVNQFGAGVSIDNLGENVTNAAEARASAQLYYDPVSYTHLDVYKRQQTSSRTKSPSRIGTGRFALGS